MDAQKVFDAYRKKNKLKTFKLTKGQAIIIEDSGCPFLIMTAEERREAWKNVLIVPMSTMMAKKEESEEARRLRRFMEIELERKKDIALNALKTKGRIQRDIKKAVPKIKFDERVSIKVLKVAPRKPGTNIAKYYAEMVAYVKKHPKAPVAEVIANTSYRMIDYQCDLKRKNIAAEPL